MEEKVSLDTPPTNVQEALDNIWRRFRNIENVTLLLIDDYAKRRTVDGKPIPQVEWGQSVSDTIESWLEDIEGMANDD